MPNVDNIHQDHPTDQVVAVFHGLNATDPPHLLADDEVASSTNIDFTLEYGAASVRRGTTKIVNIAGTSTFNPNWFSVEFPTINQAQSNNNDGIMYVGVGSALYRNYPTGTVTLISTASTTDAGWVGVTYKGFSYFIGGNGFGQAVTVKDNGTNSTDWIKQVPATAPTVTVNTLTPATIISTFTASEGTLSSTNTIACDATTFRADVEAAVATNILETNAGNTIGDYGIISVQISLSEPKNVNRVSMDFGIGTNFNNYYHTELDMVSFADAYPDPTVLAQSQLQQPTIIKGTTTISNVNITNFSRTELAQTLRNKNRPAKSQMSVARNSFNTWIIPKPKFSPIFQDPNPGSWTNVGTARIVIEGTGTFTATITNFRINGAQKFSLMDIDNGYSWWETFAAIDSLTGNILGESAPSPASARTKIQGANVILTGATGPTGNHGITHRIFYRQGGYLNDAYAVGTVALATATLTDIITDFDALALAQPMLSNIQTIAEFGGGGRAATSYYDRIFLILSTAAAGNANTLAWSLPGRPDAFPRTSSVQVGDNGEVGMALIPWLPRLVLISERSVYEVVGNFFEPPEADYIISKTGSKHGSKSRSVPIVTPYGIPLIDYDGLYMYKPGQGVDEPMDWVMAKIQDMFRGTAANDPAGVKGNRVPVINFNNMVSAAAAYGDNKLYISLPTTDDTNNSAHIVLVIDFRFQKVFLFSYPFSFSNIFWDQFKNQLFAATVPGHNIMQLETGVVDTVEAGTTQGITFKVQTRAWPAPTEILAENISLQYRGGTASVLAVYDQTNTRTVGTLSNTQKVWTTPTLGGTIGNDIYFVIAGTQTNTATSTPTVLYQLAWDNWIQPKRVNYYRTDYDDSGTPHEKIYDVHYTDAQLIGSGTVSATVLATSFVDNVAISTFTLTAGTGTNEKLRYEFAYPAETYGNIEYTVYQAQGSATFKLYSHHLGVREEPPRTTIYDSDRVSSSEQWWREVCSDINPLGGTVTAVLYVDEVAQATFSLTQSLSTASLPNGVGRTIFPNAPQVQELYGKVAYVRYSSTTVFKHYRTWYITEPQPDRLLFVESSYDTEPSVGVIKTWLVEADTLGGTMTGTCYIDNIALQTSTFSFPKKKIFEMALPNITTGKSLKTVYTSTTPFKHWRTYFEVDQKPFYKTAWNFIYKRVSPITQLEMGRFWQLDIETEGNASVGTNTATLTSTWQLDGTIVSTNTYVLATATRTYFDRVSFPPGVIGYLYQQQISSDQPIHIWSTTIDVEHVGVKGFARTIKIPGTPEEQQTLHPAEGPVEQRPYAAKYQ